MAAERITGIHASELDAEMLAVYQTDLIAQIELQLRAAHRTLRLIEQLRAAPHRVGPELTDTQRGETLTTLSSELTDLERQLTTQHDSFTDFQETIAKMKNRLNDLRQKAGLDDTGAPHPDRS